MSQRVSTLVIRQQLGDILNRVALRHDEFIVERKGKPLAAIVSIQKLDSLREATRVFALNALSKPASTAMTPNEAMDLANTAKHAVRRAQKKK